MLAQGSVFGECTSSSCQARWCTKYTNRTGVSLFDYSDEPSTDLCLHRDLYLANVHQRAAKRDGVRSIRIEQELACSIIATRKLPVADPVGSDI